MSRADKQGQGWNAPPVPSEFKMGSTAGRPGRITTPGVLAIIFGIFGTLGGLALVAMAGNADVRKDSQLSTGDLRMVGAGALVLSVGAIVSGVFVLRGRAWARIALTVLAAAFIAFSIPEFSTSGIVGTIIALILVLMLWSKSASQWFKDQRN